MYCFAFKLKLTAFAPINLFSDSWTIYANEAVCGNKIEFSVQIRGNNKLWITKCTSPEKKYIDHKHSTCAESLANLNVKIVQAWFSLGKYMQENGVVFFFTTCWKIKIINYTDIVFVFLFLKKLRSIITWFLTIWYSSATQNRLIYGIFTMKILKNFPMYGQQQDNNTQKLICCIRPY